MGQGPRRHRRIACVHASGVVVICVHILDIEAEISVLLLDAFDLEFIMTSCIFIHFSSNQILQPAALTVVIKHGRHRSNLDPNLAVGPRVVELDLGELDLRLLGRLFPS